MGKVLEFQVFVKILVSTLPCSPLLKHCMLHIFQVSNVKINLTSVEKVLMSLNVIQTMALNIKYFILENERFPTLADEISTIKEALDGAPVHAKEAVLKILERLTARVDRAERDRDLAVTRFRELNIKYETLEDELAKKRGELRELLRQVDCKPERDEESRNSKPSLESKDEDCDARSERSSESSASKADSYSKSGLPKIELKSPAKILEEISSPHSSSVSAGSEDRDSDIINQPTKVRNIENSNIDNSLNFNFSL